MINISPGVYVAADQIAKCELTPMIVPRKPDIEWGIMVTLKSGAVYAFDIAKSAIDYWADEATVLARHEENRKQWAAMTNSDYFPLPKSFTREEGAHHVLRKFVEAIDDDLDRRSNPRTVSGL